MDPDDVEPILRDFRGQEDAIARSSRRGRRARPVDGFRGEASEARAVWQAAAAAPQAGRRAAVDGTVVIERAGKRAQVRPGPHHGDLGPQAGAAATA